MTITKQELIEQLKACDAPGDAHVYFKLDPLQEYACGSVYSEKNFMGYSVTIEPV